MPEISAALRSEVRSRAENRCEYCLTPELVSLIGHELDHIIATKHGGQTDLANLALCCALCNKHKGTDIASIDRETSELVRLFNPRLDHWSDHFELQGPRLIGRTAVGRVTSRLLQWNRVERLKERSMMIQAGLLTGPQD